MQLFYLPEVSENDEQILFPKDESRHITKVLRKSEGDQIHATNGKGFFFKATLVSSNPKQCAAVIDSFKKQDPLPYQLHLAVAPTKLNDRYEWFLEKATEIGITHITPIICDHSERKVIKEERFHKIIVSAAKQSLKAHLPILNPAIALKKFLNQQHDEGLQCIAHCEKTDRKSLKSVLEQHTSILILIGPEGDFSSSEIEQATSNGFIPVTLGTNRLRTETAAIVACHSVAYVNEK